VVRAHGTALYRREADKWVAVVSGAHRPTVAPAYATNAPQGPAAILETMRRTIDSVPKDATPAQRAVIEEELAAASATIKARLARAGQGYAVAAGPEHGQYLRFVQALSDEKAGARTLALVTRGGEENLRLLRDGKVDLALAQGDAALAAYEGKGPFAADGPDSTLRAVGSLYPEPVHVLVRVDSGFGSVGDLRQRRVAIGPQGSASRTTALRVLEAHGLSLKDIQPVEATIGDALTGLRDKEVDAVVQVIGVPADSVRDALVQIPLRLLPLSERAVAALAGAHTGYFAYSIPRGAYANQRQDVRTVATAALLLAGSNLSGKEVAAVTRHVFGKSRDLASRGSAQGTQVAPANARNGLSVPLHVAAAKALDAMTVGARPGAAPAKN
jgi:TRAP transporter TAXI family solute receptor